MDDREQRGLAIAAACRIDHKGWIYLVPSQSGKGKYTVCPDPTSPHCTCPDHETRGVKCKHIFAVELVMKRELSADGTETLTKTMTVTETVQRKTYPQDWPAYNAAQVNEKDEFQTLLRGLCDQVPDIIAPGVRGRPRIPMGDSIFMACYKVYSTVSGRRFMCDLDDAREKGYIQKTPHFNSIFNALESEELTPILTRLILTAAAPLKEIESDFAVDSSGFTTSRFVRWFDHKYGVPRQEHEWVKVHLMCGVTTNVVTAVEIHGKDAQDCPILPSLVETTAETFDIREVSGDKAYGSFKNYDMIEAVGATPFIPFKSHQGGGTKGRRKHELWTQMFHYFSFRREEFCQHYHKRSNVESTFSMIKAKFRDHVRSKTDTAMKNEVLCKILAHNICCLISAMYELGLQPVFEEIVSCTKKVSLAQ